MNVAIFGATGMVGQGVLRECLLDERIERVLVIGRRPTGETHAKLEEILHQDFQDFSALQQQLRGIDACFFCLGISSVGMKEADYRRVTRDVAVAAAQALLAANPPLREVKFLFVSGAGTDSTEKGRSMWARVKGEAENALLRLPFKEAVMFRPGVIQPLHGVASRTALYKWMYILLAPLVFVLRRLFPQAITTTEQIGRAMITIAAHGAPKPVLTNADINAVV